MINLNNENSRLFYIIISDIFFLLFVIIFTRKGQVKLQINNAKYQMKVAFLLYLIFFILNGVALYWYKVNPVSGMWFQAGLVVIFCVISLFLPLKNGEKISEIGFNSNYFYLNFLLFIPLGFMFLFPGGIEMFNKGIIIFPKVFIWVGVTEEVVFRAYLQSRSESYFGKYLGLFVASLLFAIFHFSILFAGKVLDINFIYGIVLNFLGGLLFGIIYIRTRSLIPCILLHTFGDSFG